MAPSERAIVDLLFEGEGSFPLEHRSSQQVYRLGEFSVAGTTAGAAARSFPQLRPDPDLNSERQSLAHHLECPPDKILGLTSLMPLLYGAAAAAAIPMRVRCTRRSPPPNRPAARSAA